MSERITLTPEPRAALAHARYLVAACQNPNPNNRARLPPIGPFWSSPAHVRLRFVLYAGQWFGGICPVWLGEVRMWWVTPPLQTRTVANRPWSRTRNRGQTTTHGGVTTDDSGMRS